MSAALAEPRRPRALKTASRAIFRNRTPSRGRSAGYRFVASRENAYAYEKSRQDRQSLQTDPIGYLDDFNLYAYVGADPTNATDPAGLDRACAKAIGTRILSCVHVDADGDGETEDDDLTRNQQIAIESAFRPFILRNSGQDLSSHGAQVYGDQTGARGEQTNFVRAVSQFIGYASGGWGDIKIQVADSEGLTWAAYGGTGVSVSSSTRGVAWESGRERWIGINRDARSNFTHAGNLARTLIHESLHHRWGLVLSPSGHQRLDAEARRLLGVYGLGAGGCEGIGGIFGHFYSHPPC